MAEGQDPVQHPVPDYNIFRGGILHFHDHEVPLLCKKRCNERCAQYLRGGGDPLTGGDNPGGGLSLANQAVPLLDERSAEGDIPDFGHSEHLPLL